tara:strand:+ start:5362 stop:6195 length:834 start_codon:yes stop_codon:yes gene_type:complete
MGIRSQISAIVANQLGRIEGEIEARVQTEATKLLSEFASKCPNRELLVQIVKVRNNLLRVVNTFQKTTEKLNSIPKKLEPPIRVAKMIIKLLKRNPVKLATGFKPSFSDFDRGGLVATKTAGFVTKQADRLVQVDKLLEDLQDDLSAVKGLLGSVQPSVDNIKRLLESVNKSVEVCAEDLQAKDKEGLKELLDSVRPLENTGSEKNTNQEYRYKAANGRAYDLAIIEDRSLDTPVIRRVAVAKDNIGIIVLRGEPSFSSDTKVLLDEIKFRIDNQLP